MIQLRKCHGGRLENTAFTLAVQFGGRNSVYRYFMSPVPRLPRVFIAAYITRPELRGSQKFPSRDRSEFVSFAGDSFTARNCCNVTTKIGQFRLYSWSFLFHYVCVQKILRCVQFEFLRRSSLSAFSTDDRISQLANDESYARKILLTAWLKLSNVSWQKVSTQFVGTRSRNISFAKRHILHARRLFSREFLEKFVDSMQFLTWKESRRQKDAEFINISRNDRSTLIE